MRGGGGGVWQPCIIYIYIYIKGLGSNPNIDTEPHRYQATTNPLLSLLICTLAQ